MSRMKPTRAGIIGLWDYTEQVFAFADGRLVLRGANGSGKTKALEVLFPFVLDGRLDARRLDPFSGENRTMKENLLCGRDGESGYGYAWLEFGDGTRFVTVGVGMVARRSQPRPTPWFFVAEGRVEEEIQLVEPDGRPRTRAQLQEALGREVVVDQAREHRARVDAALFGLGPDRYDAMLDLVLTLRRPMLAKDLDPTLLSDTLSRGLRPLDDELLEQAARTFDDLERVQHDLDRLVASDTAAQSFLTDYRGHLRTQARWRVDAVVEASAALAAAEGGLAAALAAVDTARADEAMADADHASARQDLAATRARREALLASDAYRSLGELEHLRQFVANLQQQLERAEAEAQRLAGAAETADTEAVAAERSANERASELHAQTLRVADAASASGIPWSELGDDPDPTAVRAAAEAGRIARQADLKAVRSLVDAVDDADRRLTVAEEELVAAERDERLVRGDLGAADAAVGTARTELVAQVQAWAADNAVVVEAGDADAVTAAVAGLGELGDGVLTPAEVWRALDEPRRAAATERRADLRVQAVALGEQRSALQIRRDDVAAETDDAPPAVPWRGQGREGRAGAPLWRLVRFSDGTSDNDAAGLEAALEAAGLLDAWVRPDGGFDLGGTAGDALLDASSPPVDGPDLAELLAVEEQDLVPVEVVARILAAVAVTPDAGPSSVAVGADGTYRLGLLAGRHAGDAPRYIGATARAAHRARRVADLDREIGDLDRALAQVSAATTEIEEWLAAVEGATAALPGPGPVLEAVRHRDGKAAELSAVRRRAVSAREASERWRREIARRRSELTREAGRRRLPTTATELDAVADAITQFAEAARDLVDLLRRVATLVEAATLSHRQAVAARAAASEAASARDERSREHAGKAAELEVLTKQVGPEADDVRGQLETIGAAVAEQEEAEQVAVERHRHATGARERAESAQEGAAAAVDRVRDEVAVTRDHLVVLRRPDVAAAIGLPDPAPEEPGALVDAITDLVVDVSPAEERRKAAQTRALTSFEELQGALGAGYHPAHDVDDGVIVVTVDDDHGTRSAAAFAAALRREREEQEVLLEARERALFEDALLSAICRQIHQRVLDTRDLVAAMDQEMRARRLSSGQTVGVAWHSADALTPEWKDVQRLLDTDPEHFAPEQLEAIRRHFAAEIAAARRTDRDTPYRELLARVLDYRAWRRFDLTLVEPDGSGMPLTKARHARLSGGEKAASLHLPLFAAAHAAFGAARPDCPRLLALDEAFAGIDDQGRSELLSLTVAFDLDLFMTGYDLWAVHPKVPAVAHHDLLHLVDERTVSSILVLWNGQELIEGPDAEAELAGMGGGVDAP